METPSANSMAAIRSGSVNNPKVCIRDWNTTFACVCPKCSKQFNEGLKQKYEEMDEYIKNNQTKQTMKNHTNFKDEIFAYERDMSFVMSFAKAIASVIVIVLIGISAFALSNWYNRTHWTELTAMQAEYR